MAAEDDDLWFFSEDGCISIGQLSKSVTYHPNLNTIIITTDEPAVRVLDVTSGSVLQTSSLSRGLIKSLFYVHSHDSVLSVSVLSLSLPSCSHRMTAADVLASLSRQSFCD
jgi:hypothetical protein